MSVHTINLRGPWRIEPLCRTQWKDGCSVECDSGEPLPKGGRLNPVGDWSPLLGNFRGRVRYERSFHQPTGLSGQDLFLVVEGVDALGQVLLNEQPLGEIAWGESHAWNIDALLQSRNRLHLIIDLPEATDVGEPLRREGREDSDPGGLIGGVRLEIRPRSPRV